MEIKVSVSRKESKENKSKDVKCFKVLCPSFWEMAYKWLTHFQVSWTKVTSVTKCCKSCLNLSPTLSLAKGGRKAIKPFS